jgi:glycosyltransferase involved in cell wall biosynthesis
LPEARADVRNVMHARQHRRELIHTRDPFALTLALAAGLRCVFETYRVDINEDARFGPWRALNYRRKNLLGVITHSDLCRQSFVKAGIPEARVLTNYNGYAAAHFTPPLTREAARAHLGLETAECIATYAGRVDVTKGTDFLVRVAQQLPNVIFLLVGAAPGSAEERTVLQHIQNVGVKNVRLRPRVAPSEVAAYLFASDCLVIPPTAAPLREHGRTVLPMKTFSYLAAGRPIVAPDRPYVWPSPTGPTPKNWDTRRGETRPISPGRRGPSASPHFSKASAPDFGLERQTKASKLPGNEEGS